MSDRQSADDLLVRYLLGDALPGAQQEAIEQRYFTDDVYFDHLLAIEDELIDSHIRGNLSDSERARFEKHFLASNRRREKWEAQRAIASFFRSRREPTGLVNAIRFFRSLTLGARLLAGAWLLVVAVGVVLLSWGYIDVRRENARLLNLREQSAGLPVVAMFTLRPERLRAGAGDQFHIATDTRWVVLQVEVPQIAAMYSSFAAGLSTADGQEVWGQRGLPRVGAVFEIDLPASMLKRGDYVLSLSALDGAREMKLPAHQFRIDR